MGPTVPGRNRRTQKRDTTELELDMLRSDDLPEGHLHDEAWMDSLSSMCGRHNLKGIDPNTFAGWLRPVAVCGLTGLDLGCNARQIERTHRDVRLDGVDHYAAIFQIAGQSAIVHNDRAVQLAPGNIALVDAARPWTFSAHNGNAPWNCVTLHLPRQALVSHVGFEPPAGLCGGVGTSAGRMLFDLVRDARQDHGCPLSPADSYMQLVVYDLIGALFAPSDPAVTRHTDKLFARVRGLITDRFADPDFGPREVAVETGISIRYVQKLFTQRGSTCSEFIYSLRLDHAARLLHRRASVGASQPLSDIAYACGFRDYTHFARKFRHRFGCAPGARGRPRADDQTAHAGAAHGASRPHDVQPPPT
jgi:AraC family transcriptional activator of tynA and feaB